MKCNCYNIPNYDIDSLKCLEDTKRFFQEGIHQGIYREVPVRKPYHTYKDEYQDVKWYANKWYKCCVCKCLWEVLYPNPPAFGFVRKLPPGQYYEE